MYNVALYEFEKHKIREIIDLLNERTIKKVIERWFHDDNKQPVLDDVNSTIHAKECYKDILPTIESDLDEFIELIRTKSSSLSSPSTITQTKEIKEHISNTLAIREKDIDISEHIESITELRKSNNQDAVIKLLEQYKNDNWSTINDDVRYKVLANLGLAYYEVGNTKEAGENLTESKKYKKDNNALALAAFGESLIGNKSNAKKQAEKILKEDDKNENAYLALLSAEVDNIHSEVINKYVPDHILQQPNITLTVANIFNSKGEYIEAKKILLPILNTVKEDGVLKYELKYSLGIALFNILKIDNIYFTSVTEEQTNELKEILTIYKEVWNFFKDTSLRQAKWSIPANMGVLNHILGNTKEAIANLKTAIGLKENFFSYYNLLLLEIEDKKEYANILERMSTLELNNKEQIQYTIIKSEFLLSNHDADGAIILLKKHLVLSQSSEYEREYYTLLIDSYLILNKISDAKSHWNNLRSKYDNDYFVKCIEINILIREKKYNQIEQKILEALTLIKSEDSVAYHYRLADISFPYRLYDTTIKILEPIIEFQFGNSILKYENYLLLSYYHVKNFKTLIPIVVQYHSISPSDINTIDLLSSCYEHVKEYDKAINILDEYLTNSNDAQLIIKKSLLYCKKGDFETGSKLLNDIPSIGELPIDMQLFIANAYIQNKEIEKGLELAYKIRKDNFDDILIHEKYIYLVSDMDTQENDVYYPPTIQNNSYVVVEDDNHNMKEYIISEKPTSEKETSIFSTTGKALRNKRIDDIVTIDNKSYQIKSIIWKYTQAYQESISKIQRSNSPNVGIQVFNNTDKIFELISQGNNYEQQVKHLYIKGQATLGSSASLMKENVIQFWSKVVNSNETGIFSVGNRKEYEDGNALINSNTPIIIDLIGILTLYHIKAISLLNKINNKVYVSKSTLSVIQEQINETRKHLGRTEHRIQKIGQQYFRNEITDEIRQREISTLEKIYSEIQNICIIADNVLVENKELKDKADMVLGESFNDTYLYAEENSCLVFSDDLMFRLLIKNDKGVLGLSTFHFLSYLSSQRIITQEEYTAFIISLIKLNYKIIPVNEKILYELLVESKYKIAHPFTTGCDILSQPENITQLALITINFLQKLYVETTAMDKRFITQFVINEFYKNKDRELAKSTISTILDQKFLLLPIYKDEISIYL